MQKLLVVRNKTNKKLYYVAIKVINLCYAYCGDVGMLSNHKVCNNKNMKDTLYCRNCNKDWNGLALWRNYIQGSG